ncbi:MAG: hypothetical protein ACOCYG_06160, partial [Spirochaetota bacterium]
MELSQLAEGLVRIERHGNEYLGITTYIPTNSFAVTKLTTQRRDDGFIVRGEEVETWKANGFTEYAGRLFLYGPYLEGRTLSEIIRGNADDVLPYLSRLARAMQVLQSQRAITPYIHTRGIIFLNGGGVLFLPRDLMKSIRDFQSPTDRIEFRELYRHPDVPTEQEPSFALAVTAYRCLTGSFPYNAETEEDLRERMRTGHVERPMYIRPEIREDVSNTLHKALLDPSSHLPRLEEWEAHFSEWLREGPYQELPEERRLEIQAKAEAERAGLTRAFRRQEYFRRNWKKLVAITLVAILIGTIPATVIYNKLQPSPTAGLPPDEVVRAFYTSITTLDHQTMEGATVDGAGSALIDEVTGVYVFSRMRLAVELREAFADPQQWRDEGMPLLEEGRSVYGIANFTVEAQRSPDPEEEVFRVRYEKWSPQQPADEDPTGAEVRAPEGQVITERVFLRRERGEW